MKKHRKLNAAVLAALLAAAVPSNSNAQDASPAFAEPVPPEQRMQVEPVLDTPLRDPSICRGPDGVFYLTGTIPSKSSADSIQSSENLPEHRTPNTEHSLDWSNNAGIRMWKSKDLKNWEDMGLVWDGPGRDGAHQWITRPVGDADTIGSLRHNAGIIAPEIHYLKDTYWLTFSRNNMGTGLLRSSSGKPEGPYEAVGKRSSRITHWGRDASLFQDDDGSVYWLWSGPNIFIAKMAEDMSGLAEAPRALTCEQPPNTVSRGDAKVPQSGIVGRYGPFLYKANGVYHLTAAEITPKHTANISTTFVARSKDSVYGPYGAKQLFVDHSGQSTAFQDNEGGWHATFCGLDASATFQDRVGIVPLEWLEGYLVSYYPNPIKTNPFDSGPLMTVNRYKVFTERGPWAKLRPIIPETMEVVDGNKSLNLWDTGLLCAPDGYFYVTGSQNGEDYIHKLRVWRSKDLRNWEAHVIRTFDDEKRMSQKRKETVTGDLGDCYMDCKISWLAKQKTFAVSYTAYSTKNKTVGLTKDEMGGYLGVLVSESGTIEGPWRWHDTAAHSSHYYELDDGRTVEGGGVNTIKIYKPGYWDVRTEGEQPIGNEYMVYRQGQIAPPDTFAHFHEDSGTHLHPVGDQWILMPCTINYPGVFGQPPEFQAYSTSWLVADSPEGPWEKWRPGVPHGGHAGFTQGPDGNWYALAWLWNSTRPLYCHSPAIVKMNVQIQDGKLQRMEIDPDWTAEDYVVPDWVE